MKWVKLKISIGLEAIHGCKFLVLNFRSISSCAHVARKSDERTVPLPHALLDVSATFSVTEELIGKNQRQSRSL
jgi:hypothetical protein